VPTVPGVQDGVPLFRNSGWHTYNWANYGPVYAPAAFSAVSVSNLTATTAQINFTPGYSGSARVMYAVGGKGAMRSSATVACTAGVATNVTLRNLDASTTYTYHVLQYLQLTDQTGQALVQTGYSDQAAFSTAGGAQVGPVISPPMVTIQGPASNRTVIFSWNTDVPCISKVNYGATASYGTTRNDTTTPANQTGASITSGKLIAGNTYHYQQVSQGRDYAHGLVTSGSDLTFVA